MPSPYGNIETKVEVALVSQINSIASRLPGITIHNGIENLTLLAPNVVVNSTGAMEHIKGTGLYLVDVNVEVTSQAQDTTPALHRQRVATVRDEINVDWIGASLNAAIPDFTVSGSPANWGVILQKSHEEVRDNRWVTILPLSIYCQPS